ncbi:MYB transcription factor [Striga asiatica]|uniref:MYB transcription factor n=1 Tax=Striga asiatica TaxID=4170 RepID=A0A5A7Q1H3_STRAF|nr:MYB transcription factor [Striga asiatica]
MNWNDSLRLHTWEEDIIFKNECNTSEWTTEEDKEFESDLTLYNSDPACWERIVSTIPGRTIQEEVSWPQLSLDLLSAAQSKAPWRRPPPTRVASPIRSRCPLPDVELRRTRRSSMGGGAGSEAEASQGLADWSASEFGARLSPSPLYLHLPDSMEEADHGPSPARP